MFSAVWGDPPSLTLTKNVPIMDMTIPTADSAKGR